MTGPLFRHLRQMMSERRRHQDVAAHKWLGATFDCSLYYVRDEQHLLRVMSTNPSFLQSSVNSQVRNLRDTGIPLGRRFRALKLWRLIRERGFRSPGLSAARHREREHQTLRRDSKRGAQLEGGGTGPLANGVHQAWQPDR